MKLIPCPRCGREAVGPSTPERQGGAPVVFGRFTGGAAPVVVKCYRCTVSFRLDALAFNRLPEMTPDQLRELQLD